LKSFPARNIIIYSEYVSRLPITIGFAGDCQACGANSERTGHGGTQASFSRRENDAGHFQKVRGSHSTANNAKNATDSKKILQMKIIPIYFQY